MSTPSLTECFRIDSSVRTIAITGAGGKTSLMYALAREMASRGRKVVTTTTTKIFPPQPDQSPCLILLSEDPQLRRLPEAFLGLHHVTVGARISPKNAKIVGVDDDRIANVPTCRRPSPVEADGAAGRPIKAPEDWEPVIPPMSDLVIPVVGVDCLGKPATDQWVFRLKRFLNVTGIHGATRSLLRPLQGFWPTRRVL